MLEGENSLFVDYSDVWLNVSYLSLRKERSPLFVSAAPTSWSSLINQTNLGISVMKIAAALNVWNADSETSDAPRQFRSEIMGISISNPDSPITETTNSWSCPKELPYCIQVSLSFESIQIDLATSKLSCLRWTLDGWDDESCIFKNSTLAINTISSQHTVTCTCSSDGIFKSDLKLPQTTDREFAMFPKTALLFHQAQESLSTVFISVTVSILTVISTMSLVLLCLILIEGDKVSPAAPNLDTSEKNSKLVPLHSPSNKSLHFSFTSLDLGFLPQFSDHFPGVCFRQHTPDDYDCTHDDVISPCSGELSVRNEHSMQPLCFCMPQNDGLKHELSEYEQKIDRFFGCEHPVHADGSWTALSFANPTDWQRVPSGIYPLPLH